jgi:hypothetical protein
MIGDLILAVSLLGVESQYFKWVNQRFGQESLFEKSLRKRPEIPSKKPAI